MTTPINTQKAELNHRIAQELRAASMAQPILDWASDVNAARTLPLAEGHELQETRSWCDLLTIRYRGAIIRGVFGTIAEDGGSLIYVDQAHLLANTWLTYWRRVRAIEERGVLFCIGKSSRYAPYDVVDRIGYASPVNDPGRYGELRSGAWEQLADAQAAAKEAESYNPVGFVVLLLVRGQAEASE